MGKKTAILVALSLLGMVLVGSASTASATHSCEEERSILFITDYSDCDEAWSHCDRTVRAGVEVCVGVYQN